MSHRGKSCRDTLLQWVPLKGVLKVKCLLLPLRKSRGFYQNGYLLAFLGTHNKYPLFIATKLHELDPSAKNFRAEEDFTSMLFSNIDGTMAITNETKSR